MTDYRATPEQWAETEQWAKHGDNSDACILELRARVEALEANYKPTSNPSQIRSSLVERVHSCIVGEPECGHMQARAAIREVAAWLRETHSWTVVPAVLEQEAEI
jgi:hypothetical protein